MVGLTKEGCKRVNCRSHHPTTRKEINGENLKTQTKGTRITGLDELTRKRLLNQFGLKIRPGKQGGGHSDETASVCDEDSHEMPTSELQLGDPPQQSIPTSEILRRDNVMDEQVEEIGVRPPVRDRILSEKQSSDPRRKRGAKRKLAERRELIRLTSTAREGGVGVDEKSVEDWVRSCRHLESTIRHL